MTNLSTTTLIGIVVVLTIIVGLLVAWSSNRSQQLLLRQQMPHDLDLQGNGCVVAGCSGQLCVSADEADTIITTCEYRAEYACYRSAKCERQASGTCGWAATPELTRCLANPPSLEGSDVQVY